MANRGMTTSVPIWVRVPVIIALVLVGVLISPMLLDAAGVASRSGGGGMESEMNGGGHGASNEMEMNGGDHGSDDDSETDGGDHGSGDDGETDGGGHGSRDERGTGDHNQGQGGPAGPSEPGLAAVAAQVVSFTIDDTPIDGMRAEGDRT
jgi:hypothetical protein